jgi:ACR3 family arsenite efflux pump ArsB
VYLDPVVHHAFDVLLDTIIKSVFLYLFIQLWIGCISSVAG